MLIFQSGAVSEGGKTRYFFLRNFGFESILVPVDGKPKGDNLGGKKFSADKRKAFRIVSERS